MTDATPLPISLYPVPALNELPERLPSAGG